MTTQRRELERWLIGQDSPHAVFYVKRLSANDTGLTGGHQVGPYIPNEVGRAAFPNLPWEVRSNDQVCIRLRIVSHGLERMAVFKRYHRRKHECRVTQVRFRGHRSPLLDPEKTGSVAVFRFVRDAPDVDADTLEVWICETGDEEELLAQWLGRPIDPGTAFWMYADHVEAVRRRRPPTEEAARKAALEWQIPREWLETFPRPSELLDAAVSCVRPSEPADNVLLARRVAEFTLFSRVESEFIMRRISKGFESAEEFLAFANSMLNRRKARSGLSLELHIERLLIEAGMAPGVHFEREPLVDGRSRPDFLFPNVAAYEDQNYPAAMLRMLAAKTTVKERWRQILHEAMRITEKHTLTLDEGIGHDLLREMFGKGLRLVIPSSLHNKYAPSDRHMLISVQEFLDCLKSLYLRP